MIEISIRKILFFISTLVVVLFALQQFNNLKKLKLSENFAETIYKKEKDKYGREFYNYYFKTESNSLIRITNNINTKQPYFDEHKKYKEKKVVYLKENPEIFKVWPLKDEEKEIILNSLKLFAFFLMFSEFIRAIIKSIIKLIKKSKIRI